MPPGPPANGCMPVAMNSALDSSMGLPRRSVSALRMLALVMPDEVSSSFKVRSSRSGKVAPPESSGDSGGTQDPLAWYAA